MLWLVEHLITRVLVVILILLDVVFIIIELAGVEAFKYLSLAISCIFLVETLARLFGKG